MYGGYFKRGPTLCRHIFFDNYRHSQRRLISGIGLKKLDPGNSSETHDDPRYFKRQTIYNELRIDHTKHSLRQGIIIASNLGKKAA